MVYPSATSFTTAVPGCFSCGNITACAHAPAHTKSDITATAKNFLQFKVIIEFISMVNMLRIAIKTKSG